MDGQIESKLQSKSNTVLLLCTTVLVPMAIPALWPPASSPRVATPAILALRARRSYPFAGAGCFSSVPFPFLELARTEPSEAAVARRAGRSSPPHLDSSRQSLLRLTPHPRRTAPTSIRPFPSRNRSAAAVHHCRPPQSSASPSISPLRPPSAQIECTVSFAASSSSSPPLSPPEYV